jgi:AraC-like DNA-binding protein
LGQRVVERFARISGTDQIAIPLSLSVSDDNEDPPCNPGHPVCAKYANTEYCRESWQLHLAQLRRRPETHWHKCDHDRLCALVPVVYQDRCLAVVKLACLYSVPEEDFARQVEFLDILVKEFVNSEADFLDRLPRAIPSVVDLSTPPPDPATISPDRKTSHPQILRVLQYIEEHLTEPTLTVASTAREINVHPNYLSHLFVEQIGVRMSRFVATRRIELAKTLLATTNWQIQHIARETGHANANWFCHIFNSYTGVAPGTYRTEGRRQPRES